MKWWLIERYLRLKYGVTGMNVKRAAEYRKAFVVAIGAIVQVLFLIFGWRPEWLTPELIASIAGIIATALVIRLPNAKAP